MDDNVKQYLDMMPDAKIDRLKNQVHAVFSITIYPG